MSSFNELIDNVGLKFKTFTEGNRHYTRANLRGLGSAEGKIIGSSVQRLELLMSSIVTNANNWDLC